MAYCSDFGHSFFEPPFESLAATYDGYLMAYWKACSGLPITKIVLLFCQVLRLRYYRRK